MIEMPFLISRNLFQKKKMVLRQLATIGENTKLNPFLTILTWIQGVNIIKYKTRKIRVYIVGKVKSFFREKYKNYLNLLKLIFCPKKT